MGPETELIPPRVWNFIAAMLLLAISVLCAAQWYAFPYFLDSYYHLAVIQGFREAGGPVTHAFWEAAPEGHPHLYPPLFHLLWLPFNLLHMPPILMARIWSWTALPLLLAIVWRVLSRITTARAACLALISVSTPYIFFLSTVNNLPATLALAAGLGLMLALNRNRPVAGGLLLGFTFLLHAGIPWLLLSSLVIFTFLEPSYRKTAWIMIGVGLLASSPWLLHQFRHLSAIQFHHRGEDRFLDTPPVLLILGLIGLKLAWNRTGITRFYVALAIGFLPMAFLYRFRYFSAQGLFPWLLLAGLTLDRLIEKIRWRWAAVLLLAGLALGSPGLHRSPENLRIGFQGLYWTWSDTTLSTLSGKPEDVPRITAKPIFAEKFIDELTAVIQTHSRPDELIYCNYDYIAGMLNTLTGRAVTNQILREMAQPRLETQIAPARLIIWLKEPSGRPGQELAQLLRKHPLELLKETEIALLYQNPSGGGRRRPGHAAIPWWLAEGLLLLAIGTVVWDLKRN